MSYTPASSNGGYVPYDEKHLKKIINSGASIPVSNNDDSRLTILDIDGESGYIDFLTLRSQYDNRNCLIELFIDGNSFGVFGASSTTPSVFLGEGSTTFRNIERLFFRSSIKIEAWTASNVIGTAIFGLKVFNE